MKIRQALPVALSLVVAAGALAPAVAKPKPISDEYAVQGAPVPLPITGNEGFGETSCMEPTFEGISTTTKTIEPKGPGKLEVEVTDFEGDWDVTVMDDKGKVLAVGGGTTTPTALTQSGSVETLTLKVKKATTLNLAVCNFFGGPTANVKYVFTYS